MIGPAESKHKGHQVTHKVHKEIILKSLVIFVTSLSDEPGNLPSDVLCRRCRRRALRVKN